MTARAKAPASAGVKEIGAAPSAPSVTITPSEIKPPAAIKAPAVTSAAPEIGRVNGGRTNGGRVNGGRVNGGRVNGGRVNGGRVNGGRVNGGRVNGGRVNGGRVNGGRVNGGRVNGGRVNGGRVNGGRVNGGRVNGGRVNGGRVNGGRRVPAAELPPLVRAQYRRQTAISAAVAVVVVLALVGVIPFGGQPRGPTVDGDISDWAGTGAIIYTDTADASLPPALDLREYAVRADGGKLWFEAQAGAAFFTRPGPAPGRADDFMLLLDVDGSSSTGYAYHDLGVDRVVEVYGWGGAIQGSATRAWGSRAAYDFAGFDTAAGLAVAVRGDRIEGSLTGITGASGSGFANARAAVELRGLDANGAERIDRSSAPATIGHPSVAATVTAVSSGLLTPGSNVVSPMLSVEVENPSPATLHVASITIGSEYSPAAPVDLATVSVWRDGNDNHQVDGAGDVRLSAAPAPVSQHGSGTFLFGQPVTLAAGERAAFLAVVEHVPTNAVNGSSLRLSVDSAASIAVDGQAAVSLVEAPVAQGAQPLAYIGAPPVDVAVDGNTLEWAGRTVATDPTNDVSDAHVDITSLRGNATPAQTSFLLSFSATPLTGAIVPLKLPTAAIVPGGGGGGNGTPIVPPPNTGADYVWILVDADGDSQTGLLTQGHGYDFAVRIDGKDAHVIPGGSRLFRWDSTLSPGWTQLPQVPAVGVGAQAIEVGIAVQGPYNLTARNVTVTAYATDWQGVRDDLATPLVFTNDQGTRGQVTNDPAGSTPAPESTKWPLIPEFQDVAVPIAGVALIFVLGRRRRAGTPEA